MSRSPIHEKNKRKNYLVLFLLALMFVGLFALTIVRMS